MPFQAIEYIILAMKTYKYKFTKLMKALIIVGILLSVAGFSVNLIYLIKNGVDKAADPVYPILQYSIMFAVTVTLFVILVSILFNSCYVVDGKYFKTKFGFITSKYDVEKITAVTLDKKTDKLTVAFDSGEFIVVVVKQEWYEAFIDEILKVNPAIEYSVISLDSTGTDGKNK